MAALVVDMVAGQEVATKLIQKRMCIHLTPSFLLALFHSFITITDTHVSLDSVGCSVYMEGGYEKGVLWWMARTLSLINKYP